VGPTDSWNERSSTCNGSTDIPDTAKTYQYTHLNNLTSKQHFQLWKRTQKYKVLAVIPYFTVTRIKNSTRSCLIVAALVRQNTLPSGVFDKESC
jgi:hypothetical protein